MHLRLHFGKIQVRKPVRLTAGPLGCTRYPLTQLDMIVQGLILRYKNNLWTAQGGYPPPKQKYDGIPLSVHA